MKTPKKENRAASVGTDGGGEGGTSGNWGGGATQGEKKEKGEIPEGKKMVDPRDIKGDLG